MLLGFKQFLKVRTDTALHTTIHLVILQSYEGPEKRDMTLNL